MSFTGDSRLADSLWQGQFLTFLEVCTPLSSQPRDTSLTLAVDLAKSLAKLPELFGLTVTDRQQSAQSHDPVPFAEAYAANAGKPVILTLSGRASDMERLKGIVADAKAAGLRNFMAVSGHLSNPEADSKSWRNRNIDSVDILAMLRSFSHDFCLGAVVNPFKYTPEDQCFQYAKMQRKVNCGAQFIVVQAGWDMKKPQELQWYLQRRGLIQLLIARVSIITPEEARKLAEGYRPGIFVPVPIGTQVMQELRLPIAEYYEAQLRRAALQIVGYRKLGFAGIQIAGLNNDNHLRALFNYVREEEQRSPDYNTWLARWNETTSRMKLSPLLNPHYLFRDLLLPDKLDFRPDTPVAGSELRPPALADRCEALFNRFCLSRHQPAPLARLLQKLDLRSPERQRQMPPCLFLNNRTCPKRLLWGPCGGTTPDGLCENGRHPCFFQRLVRLAAARQAFSALEEKADD